MNLFFPIFTEKRECQDCYRCVRRCPVKAIKVENGVASVIPERCILCGACVAACPKGAKRIRDDLPRAKALLAKKPRVIVSLAPSWVAEWPGLRPGQLAAALRRLGFAGVSETALGAEQVSAHVARLLEERPHQVHLSTACPSAVELVKRYQPERAHLLTPLVSPLLAHARMLRAELGEEIGVVFVGPCIAKKLEADGAPRLVEVALTFEEIRRWFESERIDPAALREGGDDELALGRAREGALYPIDGGMIAGIRANCARNDPGFMAISGMEDLQHGLGGLEDLRPERGLFVELLACNGGCIAGPKVSREGEATACRRYRVLAGADYPATEIPRRPAVDLRAEHPAAPLAASAHREAELREVLRSLGKGSVELEPNCGGCGYDTCWEFAAALLDRKAERAMCVTHMRRLAQKKANGLLRTMPSAVVIVDKDLRILECNDNFARMFSLAGRGEPVASLEGALLRRIVPFPQFFQRVLQTGEDLKDADLRHKDTVIHGSIFTIEKGAVVGGVFYDVTRPAIQKERIIRQAREVIQKNLETVQQIAYLLGENAAESEITLQSIIEQFSTPEIDPTPSGEEPPDPRHDWKRLYRG